MSSETQAGTQIEYGVVREADGAMRSGIDLSSSGSSFRYGVEITAPGACDTCVIKENCYGSGATVWAEAETELSIGDSVRLEMRPGTVLRATGWVYGIPLLALAAGLLIGYYLLFGTATEQTRVLLSAGLALGGMVGAGAVLTRFNDWIGNRVTIKAFRTAETVRPAEPESSPA